MLKDVIAAEPRAGHRLWLRFEDGVEGEVDVSALVPFTGVFAPLADLGTFRAVKVDPELGTVCWETGADLDPDVLYATLAGDRLPGQRLPDAAE